MKQANPWLLYVLPIIWLVLGVAYARSLDAWAGIGVVILVLVSTLGLLIGVITYHVKKNWLLAIIATIISSISVFVLVILLARFA